MLVIYTSPGCASCRKVKAWLDEKQVTYVEKNLFTSILQDNELKYLLSRCENGTDDLISKRSKIIKEGHLNIESMSTSEVIELMRKNPSIIKRPIVINENNLLVGYDEEEIDVFDKQLNEKVHNSCMHECCPNYEICSKLREG